MSRTPTVERVLTGRLGLPLDVSGVVVLGAAVWALGILLVVLVVLVLVALGARADRRRRDIDIALMECLGSSARTREVATAGFGHLVRGEGRVLTWRSSLLVPDEPDVRDEAVGHLLSDARRELTTRGLAPVGEPRLEAYPVVWVDAWPDAPKGTYVTAVKARAAGLRQVPTMAMLRVTWAVAD